MTFQFVNHVLYELLLSDNWHMRFKFNYCFATALIYKEFDLVITFVFATAQRLTMRSFGTPGVEWVDYSKIRNENYSGCSRK